jgi:nuclear transport factor 2 (NTF2) superfamily protein
MGIIVFLIFGQNISAFELWNEIDTEMNPDEIIQKAREVLQVDVNSDRYVDSYDISNLFSHYGINRDRYLGLSSYPLPDKYRVITFHTKIPGYNDWDATNILIGNVFIILFRDKLLMIEVVWDDATNTNELLRGLQQKYGNYREYLDYYIFAGKRYAEHKVYEWRTNDIIIYLSYGHTYYINRQYNEQILALVRAEKEREEQEKKAQEEARKKAAEAGRVF